MIYGANMKSFLKRILILEVEENYQVFVGENATLEVISRNNRMVGAIESCGKKMAI